MFRLCHKMQWSSGFSVHRDILNMEGPIICHEVGSRFLGSVGFLTVSHSTQFTQSLACRMLDVIQALSCSQSVIIVMVRSASKLKNRYILAINN